jgi:hypothetical protein
MAGLSLRLKVDRLTGRHRPMNFAARHYDQLNVDSIRSSHMATAAGYAREC